MAKFLSSLMVAAVMGAAVADAATPVVVFDLPLTVECRDVTPQRYEASYKRKIFEAVIKISPQLLAGDEKDLKKLHYEISTGQQMPVVSFAPSSQVTSDVAGGAIAIQTDDHHGQLLVHYLVTPAAGDGHMIGDLNSSHTQYSLLAPKQILVASGTIERGSGVYYDLKPSTQDTLQKQREFACLFDVPATWRANYIVVRCKSQGVKRGLLGASEVNCGAGLLSVGLYRENDAEAMAAANELARRQQEFLDQLRADLKVAKNDGGGSRPKAPTNFKAVKKGAAASDDTSDERDAPDSSAAIEEPSPSTAVGAALQARIAEDKSLQSGLSSDARTAAGGMASAMAALRKLNAKP